VKLVQLAAEKGLKGLSITDHDTTEGYVTALPEAKKRGLRILTGVEFSTVHKGTSVHLLAYGYALHHPAIRAFCQSHQKRRLGRNLKILENLAKKGMLLKWEEVELNPTHKQTIGRPHIALAMMKRGYIQSVQEAFHLYLGEGCSCYAEWASYTPEETIDVIHQAEGQAVIAHPHLIDNRRLLEDLIQMPFDGIECFYGQFLPERHERWLKMAHKKNWLITGGSDFHGAIKPMVSLGCSWIDEPTFDKLYALQRPFTETAE